MRSLALLALVLVGACSVEVHGGGQTNPDAGAAGPDAAGVTVSCNGDVCGGAIGAITVAGFTHDQASAILETVAGLPDGFTAVPLAIERETADQSSCADPLTTTTAPVRPCGLAWLDTTPALRLGLTDAVLHTHPDRLAHEVVSGVARAWASGHEDEMIASHLTTFDDCHPCGHDAAEWCPARDAAAAILSFGGPRDAYYTDFAETAAAALATTLARPYWGGAVRWITRDDKACDPAARVLWFDQHLVQGQAIELHLGSVDAGSICGTGNDGVNIQVTTASAAAIAIKEIYYDSPAHEVFVEDDMTSAANPSFLSVEAGGDYTERVLAFAATAPIHAEVASCGCPGNAFTPYAQGDPTPVCP